MYQLKMNHCTEKCIEIKILNKVYVSISISKVLMIFAEVLNSTSDIHKNAWQQDHL